MALSISQKAWDRQFAAPCAAPREPRRLGRPVALGLLAIATAGGAYGTLPLLYGALPPLSSVSTATTPPTVSAREKSSDERDRPTPALWRALRKTP